MYSLLLLLYYYYYYYTLFEAADPQGRAAGEDRRGLHRGHAAAEGPRGGLDPQLIFILIHQLSRIQYTLFQLDIVNIYWWWCINFCRVAWSSICTQINHSHIVPISTCCVTYDSACDGIN